MMRRHGLTAARRHACRGGNRCHTTADDDGGFVLVGALVFMVVWSVVVFALLDLSQQGLEVSSGSHIRTDRIYASENALEVIVGYLAANTGPTECSDDPDSPTTLPALTFHDITVTTTCTLYSGGGVRVADLQASVAAVPQVRARIWFDDTESPVDVSVTNWMVLR